VVRVLIRMRAAALANVRQSRFGIVSLIAGAVIGLLVAGSTLLLGFTATVSSPGGADELALVILTWSVGRVGFAAFSGGDPAIQLDLFRIVPVPGRRLSRALLIVGFTDPTLLFIAVAFSALVAFGFRHGVAAGIVGVLGEAGTLALLSIVCTMVAAVVPTGSRRRQDVGTLLAAVLISAVVVMGTLIGPLLALLASGRAGALSPVLRILPTGWGADATALAAEGRPVPAVLLLVALAVSCLLLALWWPRLLAERLVAGGGSRHGGQERPRRRLLPATATGAVASRELRLWIRDPNRAGFLLIAFVVGIGACVVPLISQSTTLLLPFAGLGTIVIAAAVASNSYGFDGAALAIVLGVAGAERADVRGRQLAWFLLVGPYAVLLSVAGLLVAHQQAAWPWVLGLLPAVLGGAVGLVPLVSLVAVQPLDDNGSPGPTWVAKAYATIILVVVSTVPTVVLLVVGGLSGEAWISWLGVPAGVVTGIACTVWLGRIARARLGRRAPEIFQVLVGASGGRG
jgi:ABC-2 type transport system permease protein